MNDIAIEIILHSGNARSKCLQAIRQLTSEQYDEAATLLDEAVKELNIANKRQSEIIQASVDSENIELSLLYIHAQDHLMSTLMTKDMVVELSQFIIKTNDKLRELTVDKTADIKTILLACSGGFSTSILVASMKNAATKRGLDIEIEAVAETDIDNYEHFDVLLLGPQIEHRYSYLKKRYNVPVLMITPQDYSQMNGEKVLDYIFNYFEKGEKDYE